MLPNSAAGPLISVIGECPFGRAPPNLIRRIPQLSRSAEPPRAAVNPPPKALHLVCLDRFACGRFEPNDVVPITQKDAGNSDRRRSVYCRGTKLLTAALVMHVPARRMELGQFRSANRVRRRPTNQRDSSSHRFLTGHSGHRRPPSSRPISSHASFREPAADRRKCGTM